MNEISEPEATLHRLIEQLEAFYNDRFERPSAINDWDGLVRQANVLTSRVENLALENADLVRRYRELEMRCETAEHAQAQLSSATEQLSEKVVRLEEERKMLDEVGASLRDGLRVVKQDSEEALGRSKEIQMNIEDAVELAEQLQSNQLDIDSCNEEVAGELKSVRDAGNEKPTPPSTNDVPGSDAAKELEEGEAYYGGIDFLEGTTIRLSSEVASLAEENQALHETIEAACERMRALVRSCPPIV